MKAYTDTFVEDDNNEMGYGTVQYFDKDGNEWRVIKDRYGCYLFLKMIEGKFKSLALICSDKKGIKKIHEDYLRIQATPKFKNLSEDKKFVRYFDESGVEWKRFLTSKGCHTFYMIINGHDVECGTEYFYKKKGIKKIHNHYTDLLDHKSGE